MEGRGERLRLKYGKYLTEDEEPISEYAVGFYRVIATNKRLVCLRKFPKTFIPIAYDSIRALEHQVYILWEKLLRSLILFAISIYGYFNYTLSKETIGGLLSFLGENVPEVSNVIYAISAETLTDILLLMMLLSGILYLLEFLISLTGKLKISLEGASSIRMSTPLTRDVRELIRKAETFMERKGAYPVSGELMELESGHTYLVKEYRPERSFSLFLDEVNAGCSGLYISRTNPEQIKGEFNLGKVSIYWLTDSLTDERSISPEPDQLFALVSDFMEKNVKSVILLDGLEYLISHASFEQILHFTQGVKDKVGVHDSKLIIPISPQALSEKEMALLEREMDGVL
jgi:hypothetical protein